MCRACDTLAAYKDTACCLPNRKLCVSVPTCSNGNGNGKGHAGSSMDTAYMQEEDAIVSILQPLKTFG